MAKNIKLLSILTSVVLLTNLMIGNGVKASAADDIISITSSGYGANGYDTKDDTDAIQKALDLAKTNGKVHILIPEGTYLFSKYLHLYKNTIIDFKPGTVLKRTGNTRKCFVNNIIDKSTYVTGYNGEGNITINGNGATIDFDCQNNPIMPENSTDSIPGTSVFDLGHAKDIWINNLKIQNTQNGHAMQISSCWNVNVNGCTFYNAIHSDKTTSALETIQVEVATPESFPTFGGDSTTKSDGITISNCKFDKVIRGVGTHAYPGYDSGVDPSPLPQLYCTRIAVKNCTFTNIEDDGLSLMGYDDCTIANNTFDGVGQYGVYINRCKNIKSSDNIIKNTGKSGLYMRSGLNNTFTGDHYLNTVLLHNPKYNNINLPIIRIENSNTITFNGIEARSDVVNHTYALSALNTLGLSYDSNCQLQEGLSGLIYFA